jgi:hypothetical protein
VLAWVFRMKLKLDCLCLGRWIVWFRGGGFGGSCSYGGVV